MTDFIRPHHEAVRIESVTDPPSLQQLRQQIARRMPVVDLSAVLMEIEARTAMALEFTHIGGSDSRLDDFAVSLCAALLTQACNLPVAEVAQEHIPALAADRIIHGCTTMSVRRPFHAPTRV